MSKEELPLVAVSCEFRSELVTETSQAAHMASNEAKTQERSDNPLHPGTQQLDLCLCASRLIHLGTKSPFNLSCNPRPLRKLLSSA